MVGPPGCDSCQLTAGASAANVGASVSSSFFSVPIYSISPHLHLQPWGKQRAERVLHHCDTAGVLPLLRAPPAGVDQGIAGFLFIHAVISDVNKQSGVC